MGYSYNPVYFIARFSRAMVFVFLCSIFLLNASSFAQQSTKSLFQFQVQQYHTKRQGGQTLNLYVRYALAEDLPLEQYPDYIPMRKLALEHLDPTEKLPENIFWEVITKEIAIALQKKFPIIGVSVQIIVFPSAPGHHYEPGFHGPIYTQGEITPLAVDPPMITNFANQ